MPDSRRPAASATSPCAPSWAMVTTCRVGRQSAGERTSSAATAAVPSSTSGRRSGVVAVTCAQNRPRRPPRRPAARRVDRQHAVQPADLEQARDRAAGSHQDVQRQPAGRARRVGLQQQAQPGTGQVGDRAQVEGRRPGIAESGQGAEQLGPERLGRGQVELAGASQLDAVLGAAVRRQPATASPDRPAPATAAGASGPATSSGAAGTRNRTVVPPPRRRLDVDVLGRALCISTRPAAAEPGIGRRRPPRARSPGPSRRRAPSGRPRHRKAHSPGRLVPVGVLDGVGQRPRPAPAGGPRRRPSGSAAAVGPGRDGAAHAGELRRIGGQPPRPAGRAAAGRR